MDINEMDWIPIDGYPGYEISAYGPVCKVKKDGTRELLMPYKDKKSKHSWMYVTLWKNCQFYKIPIRKIIKDNWIPELERRKAAKTVQINVTDRYKQKRTTDPDVQSKKFREMIDGYNPGDMSVSAYMKYLRQQGYRFTTSLLSAELTKKKKKMPVKETDGLF